MLYPVFLTTVLEISTASIMHKVKITYHKGKYWLQASKNTAVKYLCIIA